MVYLISIEHCNSQLTPPFTSKWNRNGNIKSRAITTHPNIQGQTHMYISYHIFKIYIHWQALQLQLLNHLPYMTQPQSQPDTIHKTVLKKNELNINAIYTHDQRWNIQSNAKTPTLLFPACRHVCPFFVWYDRMRWNEMKGNMLISCVLSVLVSSLYWRYSIQSPGLWGAVYHCFVILVLSSGWWYTEMYGNKPIDTRCTPALRVWMHQEVWDIDETKSCCEV